MTLFTDCPLYAQEGLVKGKVVRKPTGSSFTSSITTHACPQVKEYCQCCFLQKFYVGHSSELHNCIVKHGNRQIMKRGKDKKKNNQKTSRQKLPSAAAFQKLADTYTHMDPQRNCKFSNTQSIQEMTNVREEGWTCRFFICRSFFSLNMVCQKQILQKNPL